MAAKLNSYNPTPSYPPLSRNSNSAGRSGQQIGAHDEWGGFKDAPGRNLLPTQEKRFGDAAYASGGLTLSASLGNLCVCNRLEGRNDNRSEKRQMLIQDVVNIPPKECQVCAELKTKYGDTQRKFLKEVEHLRNANQKCLTQLSSYMKGNAMQQFQQDLQLDVRFLSKDENPPTSPVSFSNEGGGGGAPADDGHKAEIQKLKDQILRLEDDLARMEMKNMNLQQELDKHGKAATAGKRSSVAPPAAAKAAAKTIDNFAQTIDSGEPKVVYKEVPGAPQPGGGGGADREAKEKKEKAAKDKKGKKGGGAGADGEGGSDDDSDSHDSDGKPRKKKKSSEEAEKKAKKERAAAAEQEEKKKKGKSGGGGGAGGDSDDEGPSGGKNNDEELRLMKEARDEADKKLFKAMRDLKNLQDQYAALDKQMNSNSALEDLQKELADLKAKYAKLQAMAGGLGGQPGAPAKSGSGGGQGGPGGHGAEHHARSGGSKNPDGSQKKEGTHGHGPGDHHDEHARKEHGSKEPHHDDHRNVSKGGTHHDVHPDGTKKAPEAEKDVKKTPEGKRKLVEEPVVVKKVDIAEIGVGPGPGYPEPEAKPDDSLRLKAPKPRTPQPMSKHKTVCAKAPRASISLSMGSSSLSQTAPAGSMSQTQQSQAGYSQTMPAGAMAGMASPDGQRRELITSPNGSSPPSPGSPPTGSRTIAGFAAGVIKLEEDAPPAKPVVRDRPSGRVQDDAMRPPSTPKISRTSSPSGSGHRSQRQAQAQAGGPPGSPGNRTTNGGPFQMTPKPGSPEMLQHAATWHPPPGSAGLPPSLGVGSAMTAAYTCGCGNVYMSDAAFCRKCGMKRPANNGFQHGIRDPSGKKEPEPYIEDVWEKHPHGGKGPDALKQELLELGAVPPPGALRPARIDSESTAPAPSPPAAAAAAAAVAVAADLVQQVPAAAVESPPQQSTTFVTDAAQGEVSNPPGA